MSNPGLSLRTVVLAATGQDLRRCTHCSLCDALPAAEVDISLEMLVQLVILNDEEVLTSRTLWSDDVLASTRHVCTSGIDMEATLLALRKEARRRNLQPPIPNLDRGSTDETGNHG